MSSVNFAVSSCSDALEHSTLSGSSSDLKTGTGNKAAGRLPLIVLSSLAVVGVSASACSSTPASGRSTTTTTSTTPAGSAGSTTTTTTTIVPVSVAGSAGSGGGAFGPVERIPVVPVPDGDDTTSVPVPGSPAYAAVVQIGFRQSGSGPPLLLVPGEDASMAWWSPALISALDQHYRVTAFDLPGVGYSSRPTAPLALPWLADVTAGVSAELGLAHPVVVGQGLGGQVALELALRHPGIPGSTVVADAGLPIGASTPMSRPVARLLGSGQATFAGLAPTLFPDSTTGSLSGPAASWVNDVREGPSDVVTRSAARAEAMMEATMWKASGTDDSGGGGAAGGLNGLGAVRVPVLVVAGADDAVFSTADSSAIASAIPGAQLHVWPGEGYNALEQDPSATASLLEEFTG